MRTPAAKVDIALSVLCAITTHDETMTAQAIAEVCECSTTYIQLVEKAAIKKLRNKVPLFSLNDYAPGHHHECHGINQ